MTDGIGRLKLGIAKSIGVDDTQQVRTRNPVRDGVDNEITRRDYDGYLASVDRLLAVNDVADFMQCLAHEIRTVLHHGCVVGGLARVNGGQVFPEWLLHDGFPVEYLDEIRAPGASLCSPILRKWLKMLSPLALDFGNDCDDIPAPLLAQARRHGLGNLLAHGHYSPTEGLLTYFSFHRLAGAITQDRKVLIARLMPHMHCALTRIHSKPPQSATHASIAQLSDRQQQIISWLIRGKTNWEISQITGTSEANVKYHLSNLMRTFAVFTRSSLVFKLCQANDPTALSSA